MKFAFMNHLSMLMAIFMKIKRKPLLENVVASVKHLRSVKDQSDQLFTQTCTLLDYYQHATLMISWATNYHLQFLSVSTRRTRKSHNTELGGSNFAIYSPSDVTEDVDYDIDASASTFFFRKMTTRSNSNSDSYMPSEDYSSLTPEKRCLWRKFHLTWNR